MDTWLPIPSAPGYEASDDGRIRSLLRGGPKELKVSPDRHGYLEFARWDGNRKSWRAVHTAVMEAHVGPRPFSQHIRHLDGDKLNNRLDNLAYGTVSENMMDQVAHGTHANASKTHCPSGHPYDELNTYRFRNTRQCRACNREAVARSKARRIGRVAA